MAPISFLWLTSFVFVDHAGLHDEVDVLEDLDVLERVAVDGDDVGPLAGLDGAGAVGPCHEVGGVDGAGLDGCKWRHAELVHVDVEFVRVEAVGIDGSVGAKGDFYAGLDRFRGVLFFDGADILHLLLVEGREVAVLLHPVDEVSGGDEVGALLFHESDVFVVDVGAVFDGVNACFGGEEDALCAVGVRGDLAAEAVCVGDDGLHLFEGVLAGLRVVALGEDAACGSDLDEVGAVLDVFADLMLDGGDAVGYALAMNVVFEGVKVLVHVAASDAERGAGGLHVRAGNVAGVDLVAEGDVGVVVGADVADGG